MNDQSPNQYTILFENDPVFATAPAQIVRIVLPLETAADAGSFRLGGFGFANLNFEVPEGQSTYTTTLDLTDTLGVIVRVTAGLDVVAQEAFWLFESLDAQTGLAPQDALAGFLPVNDSTKIGEGYVNLLLAPGSTSGSLGQLSATADIFFDDNEAIVTNTWVNAVDGILPASQIDSLTVGEADSLWVYTTASDSGSGLAAYDVYYALSGEPLQLLARGLADGSPIPLTDYLSDTTYCFTSQAIDSAGNREAFDSTRLVCFRT
ncbi:MAG TPA: hypothetical protein DCE41_02940, partial [Cytophagales bacterium]|nr:hypothetical protein [Cytophagales bacterium]